MLRKKRSEDPASVSKTTRRRVRRAAAGFSCAFLRLATQGVDAGPDSLRFGVGKGIRRRLLSRELDVLVKFEDESPQPIVETVPVSHCHCVLVTRELGTGGVESVVAALALGMPRWGVSVTVLSQRGGRTAELMRSMGVEVAVVSDGVQAQRVLSGLGSGAVAQLHNAPDFLIDLCVALGIPIVPVIHTTDINLNESQWAAEAALVERSSAAIAVSETVRASSSACPISAQRGDSGDPERCCAQISDRRRSETIEVCTRGGTRSGPRWFDGLRVPRSLRPAEEHSWPGIELSRRCRAAP